MARTLADFVFRRSHLWLSPETDRQVLSVCADSMARVLDWSDAERSEQIAATLAALQSSRAVGSRPADPAEVIP